MVKNILWFMVRSLWLVIYGKNLSHLRLPFRNYKLQTTNHKLEGGYIALTTVMIVGAVCVVITTAVLLLGIAYNKNASADISGQKARFYADACAEDGLRQIMLNVTYTTGSNVNLSFTDGSCNYSVTGAQPNKVINSTGISGNSTKRVKVTTDQTSPKINVNLWQEVITF